ncbi:unnamed protein product [Sphenostylis stenocarpa]|uniref:Uncharacterized protein n=1 Tax=Sphenostylis stenocarpa TaxID=92480 RepID=A0AA86V969_9FABA|nr:unnamed protein product [Sphenostylis stenocarpa]
MEADLIALQAQHETETPNEGTHRVHVHLHVPRLHAPLFSSHSLIKSVISVE